jgi:flagellar motor switch protein FliN
MTNGNSVAFLQDFPVEVVVELGRTRLTIREIAELGRDDVVHLDRTSDQPLDIVAGGRLLARGEIVMSGDRMALRIIEVAGETPARRAG